MSLYVYAVVNRAPSGLKGLHGEPLTAVDLDGAFVVVGAIEGAPELAVSALRAHDEAVRRIADAVDAILPARFGSLVDDESALRAALQPRRSELLEALRLVAGCAQMTLRVFLDSPRQPPPAQSGTEYLTQRLQARRLPELDSARAQLGNLVRGERIETHDTAPLVATVHHLIRRENAQAYLDAIKRADSGELRLVPSGPAPPYAFAPEAVK